MYHVLCWFIVLFRLLSVIVTFYSEFQTVINSVTVQNRTHVYMNFFDHKDLGNHLLQLCPKVVKHPVYIYRERERENGLLCYVRTSACFEVLYVPVRIIRT